LKLSESACPSQSSFLDRECDAHRGLSGFGRSDQVVVASADTSDIKLRTQSRDRTPQRRRADRSARVVRDVPAFLSGPAVFLSDDTLSPEATTVKHRRARPFETCPKEPLDRKEPRKPSLDERRRQCERDPRGPSRC